MLAAYEAEDCRDPPPTAKSDDIQARLRKLMRYVVLIEQTADLMADLHVKDWETFPKVKKRLYTHKGPFGPEVYGVKLLDRLALNLKTLSALNKAYESLAMVSLHRSCEVIINEDLIDIAFDAAIALEDHYERALRA
ncbi:hypothetical protein HOT99_gp255 [Caulobacter phage CcrBL10]|uniref:Uncharacterized protein n=1 Tax=Caulobacter phage CcrBL10 TaxID=2283269 RepID=A0A385EBX4_9CAUD|nr:hypothetical protein HOT99_gp255 [Caulobacter phage CcrBL10]AXQ68362.1 hypothetical protein CcrBL10_gp158c [Caulobacter phage CcrBL10]